jgi:glucose-1-phosphate adenylyltransferase
LPGVTIGRRCKITRCILDENCVIPDGLTIGQDMGVDAQHFFITKRGVVLVTPDMLRARAAAAKSAAAAAAPPA